MKLDCEVIRDLLPLYAEHMASPASTALVEEHLQECEACRAELEQMLQPVPVQPEPQPDAPLKGIRASLRKKRILTAAAAVLAVLCAVAAGLLAGVVTGLLHIWLGIPPILAGILTQMTLWSVNLKILGKANQGLSVRDNHVLLSQMDVPGALVVLAIAAVLVVAVLYLFFGTELGCGIRATGCNPVMSRAQGINTDLSKVIGLSLSNGLVALSGALLCQYQGYADINMGRGAVVIGLAAVVIGEAVVKHISPNFAVRLTGVLVGAVIYYLVYQVIIFVGFDTDLLKMFSALVVAAFLGVPYVKKQLARKHHVKGGIRHA